MKKKKEKEKRVCKVLLTTLNEQVAGGGLGEGNRKSQSV